jgi:hypothetical protein
MSRCVMARCGVQKFLMIAVVLYSNQGINFQPAAQCMPGVRMVLKMSLIKSASIKASLNLKAGQIVFVSPKNARH